MLQMWLCDGIIVFQMFLSILSSRPQSSLGDRLKEVLSSKSLPLFHHPCKHKVVSERGPGAVKHRHMKKITGDKWMGGGGNVAQPVVL